MSRKRHAVAPFVEPDLPITPMLDMSFQLLAFFLMTFNPTPTEGHLDVILPNQIGGGQQAADPFKDPELEDLNVRVDADDKGDVSTISISQGQAGTPAELPGKGREARASLFKDLQARLNAGKNAAAGKPYTPPKVKLELADNLNFKIVIAIMDEANRAGYPAVAPALKDEKK